MVEKETAQHFDDVAAVWENKIWVNREQFDQKVIAFCALKGDEIALDVGSGTGALAKKFPVKEMFALDISRGMLERSPLPRHRLVVGKGEQMPFLDNSFDLIKCRNLIKHLASIGPVLKEMRRVLRPGGKLLIIESAPYTREQCDIPTQVVRIVEPYHPRFRSHQELLDLVKEAGFVNIDSQQEIFREKWLAKWCEAKKATEQQRDLIYNLYKKAPQFFVEGQRLQLFEEEKEILNDMPWSIIKAHK